MAKGRVPVTVSQKVIVHVIAVPMANVALKVTDDVMTIHVKPFVQNDLAAKVKVADRNVTSHEIVISRATGNNPMKRSSSPVNEPRPKSFGRGSGVS